MAQTPDFEELRAPELTLPPLGNRTTDIRLLTLLPGRIGDHIRCMLSTASLASNETKYSALSYTWGDLSGQRSIQCNGCRAYIRRNLHSALSRLRDMNQAVVLWADALCINQLETDEALEEREVQVQLMHKIFSQAELVYVDLGEDVPEMDKMLQLLQKFDFLRHCTMQEIAKFFPAFEACGFPGIEHPTWPGIVRFMRRPWFTRVWIMQEFILAKHVQIMVGIRRLNLEFLHWLVIACAYYWSFGSPINHNLAVLYFRLRAQLELGLNNLTNLLKARADRRDGTDQQNLASLLKKSRAFDATDKRDRAYALLSLADDVDHNIFAVRYKNETLDQTAQRVSRYFLVESDDCHGYGRAALYHNVGLRGPGPSWTYDLAGTARYEDVLARDSRIYHASAGSSHLEASIAGAILTVRGYVLGSITQLSSALVPPEPGQSSFAIYFLNWILGVARWATCIQCSSNTKLNVVAVWITAFAGYFREETLDAVRYDHEEHSKISQQLSDFVEAIDELQDKFGDQGKLEDLDSSCECLISSKMFPVMRLILASASGRRLAYTNDNLLGLVSGSAEVGDVLSIFQGISLPFVLRQAQANYRLNGTAYIHNMMDGEVLRDSRWNVQNIYIC